MSENEATNAKCNRASGRRRKAFRCRKRRSFKLDAGTTLPNKWALKRLSLSIHGHFIRAKHIDMPFSAASRGIFLAGVHTEAKEQSSVAPFSQGSTSLGFEPHAITTTGWLRSV